MAQPEYITGGKKVGRAELEQTEASYDRKNFYVAATDTQGNSASVRWEVGRAPHYIKARILKWVDDPRTPYTSIADVARDSLRHRLHDLEEFAQDPNFHWGPFEHWYKLDALTQEIGDLQGRVDRARQLIEKAMASSDAVLLKAALSEVFHLVPGTREPYKSQLQALYDSYKSVALLGQGGQQP